MNEKDKEEFEKWFKENSYDYYGYEKNNQQIGWQAACEYKQKMIDELEAENAKLKECVEFYADFNSYGSTIYVRPRIPWAKRLISAFDVDDSLDGCFPCGGKRARQVLKELEEKRLRSLKVI